MSEGYSVVSSMSGAHRGQRRPMVSSANNQSSSVFPRHQGMDTLSLSSSCESNTSGTTASPRDPGHDSPMLAANSVQSTLTADSVTVEESPTVRGPVLTHQSTTAAANTHSGRSSALTGCDLSEFEHASPAMVTKIATPKNDSAEPSPLIGDEAGRLRYPSFLTPDVSPETSGKVHTSPTYGGEVCPLRYPSFMTTDGQLATVTVDNDMIEAVLESPEKKPPLPPQSPDPDSVSDEDTDSSTFNQVSPPKLTVDVASAQRLAKRLFNLEGFKKSDVSRHLSKNNDFSRVVAEEYLKMFKFQEETLDQALRKFLSAFCLIGETQERERVLVHFARRFLDCNPDAYRSPDAVHTLTCALMMLNTDLHGQNVGRKMTCNEFIENLAGLNEGQNFAKDTLRSLYASIKNQPIQWAYDSEEERQATLNGARQTPVAPVVDPTNSLLEVPNAGAAVEYKRGYLMRKSCYDSNGKRVPFGKRGWKMYYVTLCDLVLYLHKVSDAASSNSSSRCSYLATG